MYAVKRNGAEARGISSEADLQPGELLWPGELPGNPYDHSDTGLIIDGGSVRAKTGTELRPRVPDAITRAQMRRVLVIRHGVTSAQVESVIATIADPVQRELAVIGWESDTVHRSHDLVSMIGSALGLTPEQIDQDFIDAPTLGAP